MTNSKMTKRWFEVFDALKAFASSQGQCEEMTDAVMAVLNKNQKGRA